MASEAVRAVLNHVVSALEPLGYPCALIGGVALAVWHYPRATRDVDLLIGIGRGDIEPVIDRLGTCGCRPKRSPPVVSVGSHHFVQFLYTPPGEFYDVQFDLLLAESDLEKSAITRRVQRDVPGLERPIDVIRCDDLVLFKLLAGRMIDRADAAMLMRENRDAIDFDYLKIWTTRLNLTSELAEIWREAFPAEEPPAWNQDRNSDF
jgi:hypothetical protein